MALITDVADSWSSPVALAADQIWQARVGGIFLTTAAAPGPEDGLLLHEGTAILVSGGLSVRYRAASTGMVTIAHEAV